jgi:phosphomannomutase
METEDVLVGGEEAGGMGFQGYIPERDGTMAGLMLIEMMACRKKPMRQIVREMTDRYGDYHYERADLHIDVPGFTVPRKYIPRMLLGQHVVHVKDYDGTKMIARDGSWLMLRGSGTEPIVRVYSESQSQKRARDLLTVGKTLVHKILSR